MNYKELLLRDLCARWPYVVECEIRQREGCSPVLYDKCTCGTINGILEHRWCVKPFLRPVSSMTEEEMDKLFDILHIDKEGRDEDWIKINDDLGIKFFLPSGRWVWEMDEALSYLRSIHIDINGLISKGLALEAPEGMYNNKE